MNYLSNYESYLKNNKRYQHYRPLSKKLFCYAAKSYISYYEKNFTNYSHVGDKKIINDWVNTLRNVNTQNIYKKHLEKHFIPFLMRNLRINIRNMPSIHINWDNFCVKFQDALNEELNQESTEEEHLKWKGPQININIMLCEEAYGKENCLIEDEELEDQDNEDEDHEEQEQEQELEPHQFKTIFSVMLFLFAIYLVISV
jgi:hypothetical protein